MFKKILLSLCSILFISASFADDLNTKNKVMSNFNKWKGTRYKYGGNSTKGIDCSAFIGKVYKDGFNLKLPRTTSELKYKGSYVARHNLKVGDMVFFRKNRHVGIYVGNGEFVHSSSKYGVVKSSLNEGYYAHAFTQARRVVN